MAVDNKEEINEKLQSYVKREISWFEEEHAKVVLMARVTPYLF